MYLGWRDCVGLVRVRANFWSLIVSCDKTQKVESVGRRVERVPDGLLAGSAATAAIEGSDIKRRKKKSRKKKKFGLTGADWFPLASAPCRIHTSSDWWFSFAGGQSRGGKKEETVGGNGTESLSHLTRWSGGGPATIRSDTANLIARELAELYLLLLLLLEAAWMSREDNESDNNISKKQKVGCNISRCHWHR